ncbi:Drug/metabolite transporter [Corchorus olitorius]|uniref:WAT1-related protein n=1 Tax=Corchorus olitorius TaxID=93759 RepID=A0A1R3JSD5_9ROSI|nr:Drug/metabolite transporter [Corchorus olitorius]
MAVMGPLKEWLGWSQMITGMLAVQVFATGQQLLSKVILNQGIFIFALMAYRHLVAALCVAPFAFFLERGNSKKLTWSTYFWLFINALTGITAAMGLFYYGLRDTTATYSTNFLNIIPIVTFVLSILLGIEKLRLGTTGGRIKTLGAILCVGGAVTAGLYKGKAFYLDHPHGFHTAPVAMNVSKSHWTRGTFMLVGSCVCYAVCVIGTSMIIVGLYSFLWGRTKETTICLPPQPIAGPDEEMGETVSESGELKLKNIVITSSPSPVISVCAMEEGALNSKG